MSTESPSPSVPVLEVGADPVRRALRAARVAPHAPGTSPAPLRLVQQAARDALRELGIAPRPELARRACLVRFDPCAWPALEFQHCVLTSIAAHWLGAGQPFGMLEQGPGVFQPVQPGSSSPASHDARADACFRTEHAALRPAFQPEFVSVTCCANRARGGLGVVDAGEVFEALPPASRELALQERFRHGVATSVAATGIGLSEPRALFRALPDGVMAALDLSRTRPARDGDAGALRVLEEIDAAARARATWLQLQPGDVLFVRNHRVLHAWRAPRGSWQARRAYWRQSLLALGNFAGSEVPGMFSAGRALRPSGRLPCA